MEFFGAVVLLFLGLLSSSLLWRVKKDAFLTKEADRCLNNFCEIDDNWSSGGRVYTKGLAVVEKEGKKQFVKQAKLCDLGILD